MDNPFILTKENLTTLLNSYTEWLQNEGKTLEDGPNWTERQQKEVSIMWDTENLKDLAEDDFYQTVRNYLNSLGGAFPKHGKPRIAATKEDLIRNIDYIKDFQGEPFNLVEEIIKGDKKIPYYSWSFWTPLFQKKYPKTLCIKNNKTVQCLTTLGLYIDSSESDIENYKTISQAFQYLNSLREDLDFVELDHFMHYCVAVRTGKNLVKKLMEISPILSEFLEQVKTNNLETRKYPKRFRDFSLDVSFGQGTPANIPWIGFDMYGKDDSVGLFVNYLYFKNEKTLALVFGVKEETKPELEWPDTITGKYEKVEDVIPKATRYKDSYVYRTYEINDEGKIDAGENVIENDLDDILNLYSDINPKPIKYWILAAGTGGEMWDEFRDNRIIAVNLNMYELGDLSKYDTREEVEDVIRNGDPASKKNDILCAWEFSHVMQPGDLVIIKKGSETLLGYGEVLSDYYYDEERESYNHLRDIEWKTLNEINYTGHSGPLVVKSLTDLTKYPGYPQDLIRAINGEVESPTSQTYWWLYCNPEVWDPTTEDIGFKQRYTAINERGNKRRIYRNFENARIGDLIVGYVSTPIKQVTSIFKITKTLEELEGKEIEFEIVEQLKSPIDWEELKSLPELQSSEPFKNSQGSFYKLTPEEFDIILSLSEPPPTENVQEWTRADTMRDLFIEEKELESILESIKYKKNIILQGPPGVGKTFYARRIAYDLFNAKDPSRIAVVQFHQSYSYEDFIQGYRPTEEGNFVLRKGLFYEFCIKAQRDKENDYVFIIDEINRGNLSKIFGELMMLIENDKRGTEHGIKLPYQKESDLSFYIPENLYLIGTMNTADRSLAMVDYALRRRFRFITLNPVFNGKFSEFLTTKGVSEEIIGKIITNIVKLNGDISKESNLGKGFAIGHSYFTPTKDIEDSEEWYKTIIENEIAPLLQEYYFDDEEKAESLIAELY